MSKVYINKRSYHSGIKLLAVVFAAVFFLTGCAARTKKYVDKEVYKILQRKTKEVTSDKIIWDIDAQKKQKALAETVPLTLKDALIMAAKNNRDYQTAKEDVYLQTLSLISRRHDYHLRYGVGGSVTWSADEETKDISADLNLDLIQWLAQGTQVSLNVVEEYSQDLLDEDSIENFQTIVGLDILQPLFRGAGRSVAQANLIQAERDVIYQIRNFLRYQRNFSVTVADKYYTLLQTKNSLENYYTNYTYLKQTAGRIEMLSEAGRATPMDVDQTRQDEYRAQQNWLSANNDYQRLLDEFKIFLGMSPDINIAIEEGGLERILDSGISEIKVDPTDSIELALEKRLDLLTVRDRLKDSVRDADIALNALKTQLDLRLGVEMSSPIEQNKPSFDFEKPTYTAGLDWELPVNKVQEKSAYSQALVNLERARRDVKNTEDSIKLGILNLYRNLEESYQSYLIQQKSIELAQKRVEGTDLLLQAGRATTRDLLEAQESYLNAKNSLASAIVNYLVYYLEFLRDTETLEVDEQGVWKGDLYEKISGENG